MNKWVFGSVFSILINLVWLSMAFGLMVPNLMLLLSMLSINLLITAELNKNVTIIQYKDMKNNMHVIQKISNFLSYFLIIMSIFGQIIFGWYLLLYFILAVGIIFLVNPTLFKKQIS